MQIVRAGRSYLIFIIFLFGFIHLERNKRSFCFIGSIPIITTIINFKKKGKFMKKKIQSYFYEVWLENGKTFWNYELHEAIKFIRANKTNCVIMYRCEYINSVVIPIINYHEIKF